MNLNIYESIFYNIHFVELMEEVLSNVELQVRLHNLQLFHNHLMELLHLFDQLMKHNLIQSFDHLEEGPLL